MVVITARMLHVIFTIISWRALKLCQSQICLLSSMPFLPQWFLAVNNSWNWFVLSWNEKKKKRLLGGGCSIHFSQVAPDCLTSTRCIQLVEGLSKTARAFWLYMKGLPRGWIKEGRIAKGTYWKSECPLTACRYQQPVSTDHRSRFIAHPLQCLYLRMNHVAAIAVHTRAYQHTHIHAPN